jgi:hypothetical protein
MKGLFSTIVVAAALVSSGLTVSASAQDQATPAVSGSPQMPGPDEVVSMLATKLALSDEQKSQIRPIIAERQQKIAALRSCGSGARRTARSESDAASGPSAGRVP